MKKRIEKVETLFRKKQAYEISIKKKIKTMKQEDRAQALTDYNGVRDDFMINYKIIKGNYKSELNYLNDLEETILSKYKEFNAYKLNVLYDLDVMNQELYDTFEKDIQDLKTQKEKIIIKHKKTILDKNDKIDKINREISERFVDMADSNKEEKKIYYSEIIERKKLIFDIHKENIDIIPVYNDSQLQSTIITDYNPIHKYEINLNNVDLSIGSNVDLEEAIEELED
jgi:dGTP triphosphohydrolase